MQPNSTENPSAASPPAPPAATTFVAPSSSSSTPLGQSNLGKTKLFGIIGLLVLLIAVPVSLYVVSKPQELRQHASEATDPNAIAMVDGKSISQADITQAASEFSNQTPAQILDILIERRILDDESKKLGISVSDTEVTNAMAQSNTQDFSSVRTFTKYQLLKDKITQGQVKYIEAYVIDFWLPPLDYPAKLSADKQAIVDQRRAQKQQLLDDIQAQLTNNTDPVTVARNVYVSYPIFQGSLGMNGKIITTTISDDELKTPYLYILSPDRKKTDLSNTLESMKEGEVRQVVPQDGSGGKVVKVINVNTTQFASYGEWLQDKKQKNVKYLKSL